MRGWAILLGALLLLALTPAAPASVSATQLRIYDPAGQVESELTLKDVVRRSALAYRGPVGTVLSFKLTPKGVVRFRQLTKAVALRGAKLHRNLRVAIAVDGNVYARLPVDYRADTNGLDASEGLSLQGMSYGTALELADRIRSG